MTEKDTRFLASLVWAVLVGWGASRIAHAAGVTHGDWALVIGFGIGMAFLMVSGQEPA